MVSLKTKYVGLDLENPIVVASAGITENVERIRLAEENGASAVVMKSLFENAISRTSPTPRFKIIKHNTGNYETFTFFSYEQASGWGPDRYAEEIANAKAKLKIKIFASINCVTEEGWVTYARKMEQAGADALELNVSCPHGSITFTGKEIEKTILDVVRMVRAAISIPIIPKISPQLTAPLNMVYELKKLGANGVTIFNRATGIDIDVNSEQPIMHRGYAGHGGPWAIQYPLRWISAIAPKIDIDIAASGGVASAEDVVKYLLAGATVVQICTAIYMNGYGIIRDLIRGLEEFMEVKGYRTIEDFRGKVCTRILGTTEVDRRHLFVARIDNKKIAPCKAACPIDQSAQAYVSLIAEGKYREALQLVKEENPLPAICSRVCHHPCEEECTRGMLDQPIAIAALKRFLTDYEVKMSTPEGFPVISRRKAKIAVVGSGPAGLTAAYYLARKGYPVTIFESQSVLGGMLAVAIPEYRLPKDILKKEVASILNLGIEVKTGVEIGKDFTLDQINRDGYKAIFLAVGAHKGLKLGVPGEEAEEVVDGLSFLKAINLGKKVEIGKKVAIFGGGDTAIDSARSAIRLGAKEVYVLYRRTKEEMPARLEEVKEAEEEGVKVMYLVAPIRIIKNNGVSAVKCLNFYLEKPNASQRRWPIPVVGTEFTLEVDTVISAIGQMVEVTNLTRSSHLRLSSEGLIMVNPKSLMTSVEGVFAGGDVVTGPATVVEAIAAGKKAAKTIELYLRGENCEIEDEKQQVVKKWDVLRRENVKEADQQKMRTNSLSLRKSSFKEIKLGYSEEEAVREALRCLACGCAIGCGVCQRVCIYFAVDQVGDGFQIDEEKCDGCGLCGERCPNECISMVKLKKILSLSTKGNLS